MADTDSGSASRRRVEMGSAELRLACDCGWTGGETDVERWDAQPDRDRAVRVCPGCGEAVPEWGAFGPLDGLAYVAHGPLREALVEAGVVEAKP